MWLIILVFAAIAIGLVVLNYLEKNSIAINTRDGPLGSLEKNSIAINTRDGPLGSYKGLSVVEENLVKMMEMNFFQYPMQYIGKMIISKKKKLENTMIRLKLQFRNNLDEMRYKLYFLKKDKCRASPFLRKFRGSYSKC